MRPLRWAFVVMAVVARTASGQPVESDGGPTKVDPAPSSEVQQFDEGPVVVSGVPGAEPGTTVPLANAVATPQTLDEVSITSARPRISLNMFGDVSLQQANTPHYVDFRLGALGLLFTGRASPTLSMVGEVVIETNEERVTVLDLERMFVRQKWQRLEIGAGRDHTDLGYWNNAYHHGKWLQLTVDRPRSLRFEDDGGLLPLHGVGVWMTGRTSLAGGDARATVMLSNGRGAFEDDILNGGDIDLFKSILLHLGVEDVGRPGLRAGVSGIYDRIAPQPVDVRPALPDEQIHELVVTAYAAYRGERWTVIAELYDVRHWTREATFSSYEGFVLGGRRIGNLTPFAMFEARKTKGGEDPYYVPTPDSPRVVSFSEATIGARYEVTTWSAIKAQIQVMRSGGQLSQGAIVDWSFGL